MTARRTAIWALAVSTALVATPALAETLRDALTKAYEANPDLTGARAGQRATDEGVAIARANGRPSVGATAGINENALQTGGSGGSQVSLTPDRIATGGLQLTVPVYSGGSVRNSVRAAQKRVEAGRADLRGTESAVFSQVVAAYMDVIQNESVVSLNRANVGVLQVNLRATRDRFQIGDLTRTDVAQSEARLALARGTLETARANLIRSKENYVALVGSVPGDLEAPPPLPNIPSSPDEATRIAVESNPDVIAARQATEAAKFDVRVAQAGRLPSVSTVTGASYQNYLGSIDTGGQAINIDNSNLTGQIGLQLSLPIFQGGRTQAQVRRGQALLGQAQEREISVERNVIAQVRAAYASWLASNDVIVSSERAVSANQLSLEGVRAENSVGNRTILDILNAEQELLNSQVQLVTARRNAYVAGFTLLAAMGRAEARDLGLEGGSLYDPVANYDRVQGSFSDFGSAPAPAREATSTVDTPAQSAPIEPLPAD